ncbi:TKL protein kinase [Aphanomyces invadans]|uniref:TKL protein kinase n=1 Tax=Aphanomyces invadans TaxID=157072 RepID=A0A024USD2_9STRA|nr:TKL protein kinase [Aphanomyces invadans]ETW08558.1 TKL protein kinase [Aphanomyces invadans]|eukprot:XP_008862363.1 TKL protein kinase [Aphanomyces invadans]
MHKQDHVLELIRGWSARVGSVCPYIAPSTVQDVVRHTHESPKKLRPPRSSAGMSPIDSKLPSPKRPAWDASTQSPTPSQDACNLHIILHNHRLAVVHRTSHLSAPPLYLSTLQGMEAVYGFSMQSPADEARHRSRLDFNKSATWTLKVHPLHAINLVDPCRMRKAHLCSRSLRPFVEVACGDGASDAKRCKPSIIAGPAPVWSNGWLVLSLAPASASPCPSEFHVRVLNRCCDKDIVVGSSTVSFGTLANPYQGCGFYPLRNRRGKPTGQIKLMFVLQPETPTPPAIVPPSPKVEVAMSPTAKFLFGDELRMKKAMLKHVETSRVVVAKAPAMHSEEETKALLVQIEATVRSSTRVHLWPSHDFRGGVPVGEGIHACVKQIQVDGHAVALKEFRYEAQGRSVPPHGVVTTFRHELDVLMAIDHNNIVKLVGVVLEPRLALVTEYMDGGSVHACRHNPRLWPSIRLEQKRYIALQIACALAYLHQANIVHRDIKSHNILLSGVGSDGVMPTAKLCDLGSAFVYTGVKPCEEVGTSGYIAPEVAGGHEYSYPSDIWSFGVFLWELVTPSAYPNPFVGLSSDAFVDKVTCGTRPTLEFAGECAPILEECWRLIPSERPTADALVAELTALLHAN